MVYKYSIKHKQSGVVLAVSLMILLVMTVVGVTAMQTTSLEERMAGNAREHNLAFQAAESAIRNAETFIGQIANVAALNGQFAGAGGLYGPNDDPGDPWNIGTWAGVMNYSDTPLAEVNAQPQLFIKQTGMIPGTQGAMNIGCYGCFKGQGNVTTFEITARGTGGKDTTQAIVRGNFGRFGLL